jgi:hypothetical protein
MVCGALAFEEEGSQGPVDSNSSLGDDDAGREPTWEGERNWRCLPQDFWDI